MARKALIDAVEAACVELGFEFRTGLDYLIASQVKRLPTAWLETPKLEKTEGRNEGIKHYSLKLNLLSYGGKTHAAREENWTNLERQAAQIALSLGAHENVKAVTNLECVPAEHSLTAGGELSLSVNMGVQVVFCNG